MVLAKKTTFDTIDPKRLKKDLEREHDDIVQALSELSRVAARKWRAPVTVPDGASVTAEKNQIVLIGTGTVHPPGNPEPGDVFRVLHTASGPPVTIVSDKGVAVQGLTLGETFTIEVGWLEYMYCGAEQSWWRQVL